MKILKKTGFLTGMIICCFALSGCEFDDDSGYISVVISNNSSKHVRVRYATYYYDSWATVDKDIYPGAAINVSIYLEDEDHDSSYVTAFAFSGAKTYIVSKYKPYVKITDEDLQ